MGLAKLERFRSCVCRLSLNSRYAGELHEEKNLYYSPDEKHLRESCKAEEAAYEGFAAGWHFRALELLAEELGV